MTYKNPINVCVVCLPVNMPDGITSWLLVRRNNEPCKGELSFPGGYQNEGDSMRVAAARELEEECGLKISPFSLSFINEKLNKANRNLSFWLADAMNYYDLFDADGVYKHPIQEEEVMEVIVWNYEDKLCFPFHQEVLEELVAVM